MYIHSLIDNEQPAVLPRVLGWTAYGTFEQQMAWMDQIVAQNPTRLTSVVYGTSFEGRPLRAIVYSERAVSIFILYTYIYIN